MNIDISQIKKLRELTGYGIADCKNALEKHNGDFQIAIKELREKYASKYENAQLTDEDSKIGRLFVHLYECGSKIKFAFIKAKSDSVAMSQELCTLISNSLKDFCVDSCSGNFDSKNTEDAKNKDSFKKSLEDLLVYYREPLMIETISGYKAGVNEVIGGYFHNQASKNLNDILSAQKGAIISLKSSQNLDHDLKSKLKDFANLISMSMIGNESANVLYKEELNQDEIKAFKEKSSKDLAASGKPANVIEKIVEGQMKKFFEANTLIFSPLINPGKLEWLKIPSSEEISIEVALQKASEILKTEISIEYYRIFRIVS